MPPPPKNTNNPPLAPWTNSAITGFVMAKTLAATPSDQPPEEGAHHYSELISWPVLFLAACLAVCSFSSALRVARRPVLAQTAMIVTVPFRVGAILSLRHGIQEQRDRTPVPSLVELAGLKTDRSQRDTDAKSRQSEILALRAEAEAKAKKSTGAQSEKNEIEKNTEYIGQIPLLVDAIKATYKASIDYKLDVMGTAGTLPPLPSMEEKEWLPIGMKADDALKKAKDAGPKLSQWTVQKIDADAAKALEVATGTEADLKDADRLIDEAKIELDKFLASKAQLKQ